MAVAPKVSIQEWEGGKARQGGSLLLKMEQSMASPHGASKGLSGNVLLHGEGGRLFGAARWELTRKVLGPIREWAGRTGNGQLVRGFSMCEMLSRSIGISETSFKQMTEDSQLFGKSVIW